MLPETVKNDKTTRFGYLVQRCVILDLESRSIPFARELVLSRNLRVVIGGMTSAIMFCKMMRKSFHRKKDSNQVPLFFLDEIGFKQLRVE